MKHSGWIWMALAGWVVLVPSVSRADYDQAVESYLKEEYPQAASRFDRFISESPSDEKVPLAVYYSALCRIKLEQPVPAVERLQSLLALAAPEDADPSMAPSPSMVRLALGIAMRMTGDDTAAMRYFESSWIMASTVYERAAARENIREFIRPLRDVMAPPLRAVEMPSRSSSGPGLQARAEPSMIRRSGGAWVVQVVSAPDRAEADAVRARLEPDGWPVFEQTADVNGTTYYRIRVGPYVSESEAYTARARLRSRYLLEGWVTRK